MPWASHLKKLSRKRTGRWPWIFALILFGASLAMRLALSQWLDLRFLVFYPAIVVAALVCGWAQGVLVLFLSALAACCLFFKPSNPFELRDTIGFLLVGGFIVLLLAAMAELVNRLDKARTLQEELFRELQHRVANNFQVVVGMLRNARRKVGGVAAEETIIEIEERVWAMSQFHRHLHEGTAFINGLEPLLREVLAGVFGDMPVNIRVDIQTKTNLSLDQMTAITLLVDEAAINSAKHVFSKGCGTFFEVALRSRENGRLQLTIRDDGPGPSSIAAAEPQNRSRSLGMSVMRAFATQLGGSLQIAGAPGTTLSVEFEH